MLPEVVRTNGDGYKAVDYAKVTALLSEAIKEQQEQIRSQAETIKTQSKQLASLVDKMNQISTSMSNLMAQRKEVSNQTLSTED